MEREGPVHGYGISERIAERTDGAWRPGPGAVYPSLQKLVAGGLARSKTEGRRRLYTITPKGRAALAEIRHRTGGPRESHPDLGSLWAEVMGAEGVEGLLLLRLRRTVDAIEARLQRSAAPGGPTSALRESVVHELSQAIERVRASRSVVRGTSRPKAGAHAG
jgi:DNA-binding PadR family transcriptional regulator